MKTFEVKSGIFEGKKFKGELKNGRVYNRESVGQSFEESNCIEVDFLLETLLVEGEKRLKGIQKTFETIFDFCQFDYVKYYFKLDFNESKTKKDLFIQMRDYLNNEGFEKYNYLITYKN